MQLRLSAPSHLLLPAGEKLDDPFEVVAYGMATKPIMQYLDHWNDASLDQWWIHAEVFLQAWIMAWKKSVLVYSCWHWNNTLTSVVTSRVLCAMTVNWPCQSIGMSCNSSTCSLFSNSTLYCCWMLVIDVAIANSILEIQMFAVKLINRSILNCLELKKTCFMAPK